MVAAPMFQPNLPASRDPRSWGLQGDSSQAVVQAEMSAAAEELRRKQTQYEEEAQSAEAALAQKQATYESHLNSMRLTLQNAITAAENPNVGQVAVPPTAGQGGAMVAPVRNYEGGGVVPQVPGFQAGGSVLLGQIERSYNGAYLVWNGSEWEQHPTLSTATARANTITASSGGMGTAGQSSQGDRPGGGTIPGISASAGGAPSGPMTPPENPQGGSIVTTPSPSRPTPTPPRTGTGSTRPTTAANAPAPTAPEPAAPDHDDFGNSWTATIPTQYGDARLSLVGYVGQLGGQAVYRDENTGNHYWFDGNSWNAFEGPSARQPGQAPPSTAREPRARLVPEQGDVRAEVGQSILSRFGAPAPASPTGVGAASLGTALGEMTAPPPAPTGQAPQLSQEYLDALAAREKADQEAARERERMGAYAGAREGQRPERPPFSLRGYATGNIVPLPPGMEEPNAIVGEAEDTPTDQGGELVIDPEAFRTGLVRYTHTPTKTALAEGTAVVPVPPHMEDQLAAMAVEQEGAPVSEEEVSMLRHGGFPRALAEGGFVPVPPPSLWTGPPIDPWAGVEPSGYANMNEIANLSPMQRTRIDQGLRARGAVGGIGDVETRQMRTAPGTSGRSTYYG